MTRHAKNCTAGAVYTYHEKRKDARNSGYGTENQRIGKDSVKDFDCCCLTLQPCKNPVVTRDGYLFDKEAILEYLIVKKNEISRQLKEYEKQKKQEETELAELALAEKRSKIEEFLNSEQSMVSSKSSTSNTSISNLANGKHKELPSFWLPSQTPEAKSKKLKKPDTVVYCPMSGKPLKLKQLIDVKFKEINDPTDKKNLIAKKERYVCAVTNDVLNNSTPVAVIATTGDVVTMECVEKIIKKNWIHPLNNEKLTEKDIIPLQRGGTGYSGTNRNLEVKNERPVLQA